MHIQDYISCSLHRPQCKKRPVSAPTPPTRRQRAAGNLTAEKLKLTAKESVGLRPPRSVSLRMLLPRNFVVAALLLALPAGSRAQVCAFQLPFEVTSRDGALWIEPENGARSRLHIKGVNWAGFQVRARGRGLLPLLEGSVPLGAAHPILAPVRATRHGRLRDAQRDSPRGAPSPSTSPSCSSTVSTLCASPSRRTCSTPIWP